MLENSNNKWLLCFSTVQRQMLTADLGRLLLETGLEKKVATYFPYVIITITYVEFEFRETNNQKLYLS